MLIEISFAEEEGQERHGEERSTRREKISDHEDTEGGRSGGKDRVAWSRRIDGPFLHEREKGKMVMTIIPF